MTELVASHDSRNTSNMSAQADQNENSLSSSDNDQSVNAAPLDGSIYSTSGAIPAFVNNNTITNRLEEAKIVAAEAQSLPPP